jgi:hypothetical protein
MQELKNHHKAVARQLALGVPLKKICEILNLSYSTWSQITCQQLFKDEVARVAGELEEAIIDEAVKDPVHARLRAASVQAANLLIEEIENNDPSQGASSSTRIKAATSILDRAGYSSAPSAQVNQTLIFNLSESKLNSIMNGAKKPEVQPDSITG